MMAFSEQIEEIVYLKDLSYMDAIIEYCEETGFEIEVAAGLLSDTLKYKIQEEAEALHFLPKSNTARLPI